MSRVRSTVPSCGIPFSWAVILLTAKRLWYPAAASTVNDEPLSGDFSGVLGLALPLNSVIEEQIHPTTNNAPDGAMLASNLFTMTPSSSTPESRFLSLSLERPGSSTIPSLIGVGQHPSQLVQDPSKIQYSPVASTSNGALWWQAHIWAVTVYVDGQPKQVTLSTSSSTRFSPTAVIDSGMPIIMASKSIADGIYGALGIGPASDGNYYLSCTTPINMTVTLDNRTAIALHPLDLSTPNSDSSCLGLIQAYPEGSEVANIADIVLGVPFMRSTYTVMAYDTPDSHGNFPNASAMPSPNINPSLGLLGLTNPTVALEEFHTVRVLNQPLPNGGQGNSGHTATAPTSGKKLSVGVEVLIGLLGFFGLCFLLFAARWAYYKRSMEQSGAKATKDEVMMEDVAYRLARRSSYGSRYGPSEETIRAQKFGEYMQHQGEVKSMYADETGRTRVADDVDNEKYTDAELGYRKVKVHSDSDSEGELTPPPGTTIFNTRSTRATLISPLAIDDNAVAAVQVLELPRPISTSDYPPSPSPSHHRLVSSEASVAMPLLAHTRSDSHISLRDSGTSDWERGPLDASLPSVVAFLKHSPGIVASVRFLALHHKDGTGPTNSKILCRILNQLPSLTNLDLVDIIEVGENYQPPPGPIVNRHLDRLSFTFYHTDSATRSLKSVVRVLAFFRSVNILSLQGILEDEALADTDMVGLPLPLYALRHLEIRDVAPQSFISVMQSKSLLRNIETLQMEDTRYVNRDAQALDNLVVQ
ncbi:hypothetical protein EW026_g7256, partial [Hermanssonia centrifuga]